MKLYGPKDSFRTQKALIAARIANKQVELVDKAPPQNLFPLGLTPALEDGEVHVFGAVAIAKHLAGQTDFVPNRPETCQWVQWAEGQLQPNVLAYVLPSLSFAQVDTQTLQQSKAELIGQLQRFNTALLHKTFLVGERLSIADVSAALDLLPAFQHVLDSSARAGIENVTRWFLTVVNQPAVKEVVGEVKLVEKVATFDEATFKKHAAQTKDKKPAQQANKPAKAESKPKPKKEADEEEEEDPAVKAPKFVDPFASMPPGTFVMDAFKRVYSNEDTATKAIPYFWEHFDPEHYSIWFGEYKYPQDLTLTFMSCNLIAGMFQRLDKLNKNAFGSVCLFGTDNNSSISGVWVWRGQQLAFQLSPDWQVDYESYEWKKLDAKDEKTKKLVNEYLMWEGDFDGKKFNQGKIFK